MNMKKLEEGLVKVRSRTTTKVGGTGDIYDLVREYHLLMTGERLDPKTCKYRVVTTAYRLPHQTGGELNKVEVKVHPSSEFGKKDRAV
jgi:hypothetical protein